MQIDQGIFVVQEGGFQLYFVHGLVPTAKISFTRQKKEGRALMRLYSCILFDIYVLLEVLLLAMV